MFTVAIFRSIFELSFIKLNTLLQIKTFAFFFVIYVWPFKDSTSFDLNTFPISYSIFE